jgi:cytochrome oxidase Cu insertion factor (SCO1/SenC/PrrC family)
MSDHHWDGKSGTLNETDDSASSLATGSQSWLTVFSGENYTGKSMSFGPSSSCSKLSDHGLDNDIASFQLFDKKPVDTGTILTNFLALYPGSTTVSKSSGTCLEWYAADNHYRVYYPTIVQSGNNVNFTINLDHIIGGGSDDHATLTFVMDTDGTFNGQIKITYDMNDGAYQVPDWVLNIIDGLIQEAADEAIVLLDGAEIVFTAGAGVEMAIPTDIFIEAGAELLTCAVNHINDVVDKLFGLSDDGGSMYFPSIVSHALARMVYAYHQERYGQNGGAQLGWNQDPFLSTLGVSSWNTDKSTMCAMFTNGGSSYRAYYPDNTPGYSKAGFYSTVKMDAINDNAKDDYLAMMISFDPSGKIYSVSGSIDIWGAPDDDDDADNYVAPSSGTLAYDKNGKVVQVTKTSSTVLSQYTSVVDAYKDKMQSALDNVQYVDHSNFSAALKNIVNASAEVLTAIDNAVG